MLDIHSDVARKRENTSEIDTEAYLIFVNWNGNVFISHAGLANQYTLEQFALTMADHYIVGRLANPTDTEIIDTTLISQLEAINNAISYEEQTNILQENDNLPFILNVSALQKE